MIALRGYLVLGAVLLIVKAVQLGPDNHRGLYSPSHISDP